MKDEIKSGTKVGISDRIKSGIKITYIYHSCFCVELEHSILIFDYYKGELPPWNPEKQVYFFASHAHGDHFNLKVFDWLDRYPLAKFVLSSDIRLSDAYLERHGVPGSVRERITTARKNASFTLDGMEIETLKSTDEGVAFVIEAEGKKLYHAGDLNWWHWEGETLEYNEQMEKDYCREIDRLKGRSFDAVFLPLDPRLEGSFGWGMDYFLKQTVPDYIFPMHMWDDYDVVRRYMETETGKQWKDRIIQVTESVDGYSEWNI